jgi:3',5'-cyclic AMP phosphodiesterase CpdA
LNAWQPRLDLVVISGDLVDTPTAEEYAHLKRLLEPLALRHVGIPGNHDSREAMRTAFPEAGYAGSIGPLNQCMAAGPLDLVLLDSSVPGEPQGRLEAATLDWLEATLKAAPLRPALVFLHHPPFQTGIAHMDRQNLHIAEALEAVIRRHPRVQLVAAGHVHRAVLTRFAGVPATICPAPSHAVALDLSEKYGPSFAIEPPAFHLHSWFPGTGFGQLVSHHVPIGVFEGPHPFFGPDGRLL